MDTPGFYSPHGRVMHSHVASATELRAKLTQAKRLIDELRESNESLTLENGLLNQKAELLIKQHRQAAASLGVVEAKLETATKKLHTANARIRQLVTKDMMLEQVAGDRVVRYVNAQEIVVSVVLAKYGMTLSDLRKPDRHAYIRRCRHLICFFLRKHTDLTYKEIKAIVDRDHTTVMYAVRKVLTDYETDDSIRLVVDGLNNEITNELLILKQKSNEQPC